MLPWITVTNLLVILPLSLAVMEESSGGPSGECESACARLCCSKLYSLSSASNVPNKKKFQKYAWRELRSLIQEYESWHLPSCRYWPICLQRVYPRCLAPLSSSLSTVSLVVPSPLDNCSRMLAASSRPSSEHEWDVNTLQEKGIDIAVKNV